ncbi:coiled-coil domain-containing protein 30 isoform X1 [Salmo trutta]|uniref:coiled-coil domain-containing protein 30 isoform X1 n=1 Tax=Salmo trutta TaxID=8032 RepID=UPI00113229B7|nr:coiled-coil domain-containing protein 30 isoform X1 [Salmo trutta]XP_029575535.1 coiled-coil domain-containing protein 30 isoform X1 [Salmo trutta]XP_029575536.1 coiled-coil domain-containing protein 30 isoform X1 [Salmo trutta]
MDMDYDEVPSELDQIALRLQEGGLASSASAEECQRHLWRQLLHCEGDLRTATQELHTLRTQQATEMKEVENYVEHIRGLLEERESLTAEYEQDNEQLHADLQQIRLQQDSQRKEVVEMLAQEDLGEIGLSSTSEQVAYLLVERATLLERLEAAEKRLDTQSLTGNLREVHLQDELDHIRHTMEEELRQQRETMQCTKESMNQEQQSPAPRPWKKLFGLRKSSQSTHNGVPVHNEDVYQERSERQRLERDLEEASRRLSMAHEDIRRLTDKLESAKKTQAMCGPELERTGQEVESLRKEVDKLKQCDTLELQKAKEHNERLDGEIRVLRERVRSLDSEKKTLLQMGEGNSSEHPKDLPTLLLTTSKPEEQEQIHKRCREAVEDVGCQLRELQRRMQRQQREQEELVERNEELEALLGDAQNASKEECQRHEGELEGLHRKIKTLEADLKKICAQDQVLKDGGVVGRETETYLHQLRDSSQERVALLEARLTEEKDWRRQLEVDLGAAQAALKNNKETLQRDERELRKLRLELQGLQTECQQGKTLIKSLTQVKGEKGILEEKVAQLERAQSRLLSDREHQTESSKTQEDLRESRTQVAELGAKVERLTSVLSCLEEEHCTLRDEMVQERRRAADLQAQLSERVREKLTAEGEKERLGIELLRLREQLQLSTQTRQETARPTRPRQDTTESDHSFLLAERTKDECLNQLVSLKCELSRLHATLEEERQLANQHQLALQAQINEAQARTKSQDSVLGQKAEESKQLKQDLQRAQSLFTSAERELRYEREKNLDLKRHNALLDQEKIKVCAELKQAQAKLSQAEQSGLGQAAETERLQHKLRELELELARSGQSRNTNASLQEELQAERVRVISADKKVLELQQKLKSAHHQLRLEEARAGETNRLERDSRDMSDTLSSLRARQLEDQLQRKLLEQREEELQQQVRSLRGKEVSLGRSNSELRHLTQQLETRLAVLEAEHGKAREEQRESQRSCLQLGEELVASQQERERLQEELQQVITQLDTYIRKYNEKQSQHKTKLRKAKQIFLMATAQRDRTIQKLENDLALASSLSHKEKDWIRTVMEENEKLLVEKRELLRRMSEAEEMGSNGLRKASNVQHRVNFLEVENRQLQERTLKLANQVGTLERALRNVQSQSLCNLEDIKKMFPSESLANDSVLHKSTLSNHLSVCSLTSGACDPLGILNAICRVKVGERVEGIQTSSSTPHSQLQSFELGYLNLTSPVAPPDTKDPEESDQ